MCDGRCNGVREGVGVVRTRDGLLTKQLSLTAQILLLNMVSTALYSYHFIALATVEMSSLFSNYLPNSCLPYSSVRAVEGVALQEDLESCSLLYPSLYPAPTQSPGLGI